MKSTAVLILYTLLVLLGRYVDAFAHHALPPLLSNTRKSTTAPRASGSSQATRNMLTHLYSNKNDDNEVSSWINTRLERANFLEIRRDVTLTACFVLCRFLLYDIATGAKTVPGWELQDIVLLTGTASSAIVLATYWTIAGLLTRSFETSEFRPISTLVNVALCCPAWLATEHLFEFGPSDIGGTTLDEAVVQGFVGLSSAMLLGRALTSRWQ